MTETNTILNEDNYIVWELNTRMKLAKKGLLEHLDATKAPSESDAFAYAWKSQRHESLRECVHDGQSKSSIHGSIGTVDCRGMGDFEELFSPSKHSQSSPDA